MTDPTSLYYPPRARWHSRPVGWWLALRRRLGLEHLCLQLGLAPHFFLLGLLLPGFALWSSGQPRWGLRMVWAYGLGALVFILWLGHLVADLAFALMISLHVTSIIYVLGHVTHWRLRWRLVLSVVTLFMVAQTFYLPLRHWSEQHWVMPVRVKGQVVIVRATGVAPPVRPGDWVAYRHDSVAAGVVQMKEGYGFNRVLAQPGDWVSFSTASFRVNSKSYPRQPNMPDRGQLQVAEDHWFIWPEVEMDMHGNVNGDQTSAALFQLALVSKEQLIGRPLQRWFWRRQKFP
jgi:hypothetical protein